MRPLLFLLILGISFSSFPQKKKNSEASIPKTQTDSLTLEAILVDAEKHFILENYAKALEGFMVALDMNSESAPIHYKIAEVLAKSGEGQQALPYGLRAIALDPENKYYRISLARIYQLVGFYIEAAKTYESMLERFPADEEALYELAELYQLTGKTDDMFKTFDRIERQLGVREEIVREKQRIYMKEGKVDEVVKEYQKLINSYPNEPSYRLELVSFLIQNKKLDQAEVEISNYEEHEPFSSRITLLKSEIAWMKGNSEKSLTLLEEAFESPTLDFETKFQIISNYTMASSSSDQQERLTLITSGLADDHPDEFKAQAFVGDMLYQNGESDKALSYYLKAVRLKPANYSVWQNILNVEADMAKYDSLVKHAEEALEYFPNQALLYYFAGTGHLINKDYKKAVRMFDTGKKYTIDSKLLTVFYGQLGDAYNGLKDNEQSYRSYEKALETDPNNDHVLNNYSYFLSLDKEDLEKALEMSTQLVKDHPNNPTYLDTHGWVLYVSGDFKESKKFLERAISLDASDGTVVEHYGDVLFQLGEVEEAIVQWEHARQMGEASDLIEKKIADRKLYE